MWFLTSALSPLSVRLIRLLLKHGDYVAAGLPEIELADDERCAEFKGIITDANGGYPAYAGWKDRILGIRCNGRWNLLSLVTGMNCSLKHNRYKGECMAAIAEAIHVFGRIDILLCCTSEGD